MSIGQHLDNIESMVTSGRVRGTARTLVNIEAITEALNEARGSMPDYIKEAEAVLRQKEAILKQAELEARRIRTYADEEATTIRQLAEEQTNASLTSAREQSRKMIDQAEVIRVSEEQAEEIIHKAEKRAAAIIAKGEARVNGIISASEMEADERRPRRRQLRPGSLVRTRRARRRHVGPGADRDRHARQPVLETDRNLLHQLTRRP